MYATEASDAATRPKKIRPKLHTAIVLNRSPLLTRAPSPFERAFYAYQARIHRALHNPFPYDFYFKQGSPLEVRFNIEERRRERRAFGVPFGTVKPEDRNEATELMELSLRDEVDQSMPRIHEADTENDLTNLNRKGQRNLYLMLRTNEDGKDVWRFPTGTVEKGELLHVVRYSQGLIGYASHKPYTQAATRRLDDECGRNMDTWVVSRNPIGVYHPPKPNATDSDPKVIKYPSVPVETADVNLHRTSYSFIKPTFLPVKSAQKSRSTRTSHG